MARPRRSCLKDLLPVLRIGPPPLDRSACANGKKSQRPRSKPMTRIALDSMTCATDAPRLHPALIASAGTHPRPDGLRNSAERKSPGRWKKHEPQPAIIITHLKQRTTRRITLRQQVNCLLCNRAPARSQARQLLKRNVLLLYRQVKHRLHRLAHQRLHRSLSAQLVRWMSTRIMMTAPRRTRSLQSLQMALVLHLPLVIPRHLVLLAPAQTVRQRSRRRRSKKYREDKEVSLGTGDDNNDFGGNFPSSRVYLSMGFEQSQRAEISFVSFDFH